MNIHHKLYIALFSIALCLSCQQQQGKEDGEISLDLIVENTNKKACKDIPFVFTKSYISKKTGGAPSFVLLKQDGSLIPFQLDDLDGDSIWDELALVIDFPNEQSITLTIDTLQVKPLFEKRTSARLGYSENRDNNFISVNNHTRPTDHVAQSQPWLYLFEGPGWENDKVAFRSYFDDRNGKDIFGKKTSKLVLDTIGLPRNEEAGNYHKELWWGMDVLKVGSSLGAGAIAALSNDSLYRLGKTDKASYKLITDGPVRSIIRLTYNGWQIGDKKYDLTETISIWAGQYAFKSSLEINPKLDGNLVTGLVTIKNEKEPITIRSKDYAAVMSYGKQSENHDRLGMAIVTTMADFKSFEIADSLNSEITKTSLVVLNENPSYWFIAGWEKSDSLFTSPHSFENYVASFSENVIAK